QDAVVMEGVIELEALCVTEEEGQYTFVRGNLPFSQEYALPGCRENAVAETDFSVIRAEAQLRNPRKLQFQIQTSAVLRLYQRQPLRITESITALPEEGAEVLTETEELTVLCCVAEKKLVAADEVRLERAGHLLRCETEWQQEEIRVLANKVMLRGELSLRAVFLDGEETFSQEVRIPYSQVLECDGVRQGDEAETAYQTLQIQTGILEGEIPILSCSVTGSVRTQVSRRLRMNVVRDLYSTRWESECASETVNCPLYRRFEREASVSETFSAEEPAASVADCAWQARGAVDEDRRLCGVYHFRILYRCPKGRLHACERTVRVTAEGPVAASELFCRASLRRLSVTAADDGQLSLRFDAILRAEGAEEQNCRQLCACAVDREKPRALPAPGTLVLRSVAEGETVWSIARGYGARVEEIVSANKLQNAALMPGKLIMIPFAK
ncbi:MAG: DUF3794 domain-containing protein, partial [Clostridia bacterium]|nr:DUF3794 domain-containing protein [Clostridia bacterium]